MNIKGYINDGANWQAQCVLAYLRSHLSLVKNEIQVTRYDNCREQGYIFFMRLYTESGIKQMNIAVYEHRNSDDLCIVSCDKTTFNAPLTQDIWENMKDKWDTTANFDCGNILDCGSTIIDIFQEFEESNQ